MSNITNNSPVVTEQKLTEFYNDIKPFLGCPAYVTQEGDEQYYSTDEKVVGRWTNGKPIYQKVLMGEDVVIGGIPLISNVDEIVDFRCNHTPNNSDTDYHLLSDPGMANNQGNAGGFYPRVVNNDIVISLWGGSYNGTIYWAIFQYTKTTDSAATTIEQKPTHYSTDEQVVGTWIDGKPIYQKTWKFNTVSASNSLGMTINPENVINFFGTVVNSENECLTLNCSHPNYQNLYGLFTCIKSTSIEIRSIDGHEWSLSNLRSLKITLQYTKDTD